MLFGSPFPLVSAVIPKLFILSYHTDVRHGMHQHGLETLYQLKQEGGGEEKRKNFGEITMSETWIGIHIGHLYLGPCNVLVVLICFCI